MPVLSSIQTSDRIYETQGSRPILIFCNDMNNYICKYHTGSGSPLKLMCEYLGASYLRIWGLRVPDFALLTINKDHIPREYNLPERWFNTTCFGSRFFRTYVDVTDFTADIQSYQRKLFPYRNDLLYIALYDLWIANEDRTSNNYNLLFDVESDRAFVPIDHETIFNTRVLDRPLCELTYEDSIISSPLFINIFSRNDLNKALLSEVQANFHNKVNECQKMTPTIISEFPKDWNIDTDRLENKLFTELFDKSWTEKTFNLFLEFLQRIINIKSL